MGNELESLIVEVLGEMAPQAEDGTPLALNRDTRLFGREGLFDSLGLVTFVVAVEQAIEDKFGVAISLADDKALSQRKSPYRTVASLAEYASVLLRPAA